MRRWLPLLLACSLCAAEASAQSASYGQYLLVLDDSGSMDRSDPRRLVEMAALAFVGALEDGDQVMLAGLNELASGGATGPAFRSPREILESRDGPEQTRDIGLARLERHVGSTPCAEALTRARSILESMTTAGAPQTLLLLTDGACNDGALDSPDDWLSGLRAHREGRFRFVLLMGEGGVRPDPSLVEMARATGWTGEASVSFDARALLRAFANVLSFSRGLRYDDGGRVGLERTFAGARTVRVLAIQEQGAPQISLERVEGQARSTLLGGPTYRQPEYGWSLRTAADGPSETPYAVRSPTAGAEVLVIPVYGRLRVEAIVGPCGDAPPLPWSHERTVRAGQPACAWARLVGDPGETIHPSQSFAFAMALCSRAACDDATVMQAGPDGTFHAQLGAQLPLGRHERTFRASGGGMASPVLAARAFSAVSFGIHRITRASEPGRPLSEVALGTLPQPVRSDVQLTVSGAFPADAHASILCEIEGDSATARCLRCRPSADRVELTDPFSLQFTVYATPFCPAVSADGRPLPVQMRAIIRPDGQVPERAIPLRATLRYAQVAPARIQLARGTHVLSELHVPGPLAQTELTTSVELDQDGLQVAPAQAQRSARATEAGTMSVELAAEASDCCGVDTYLGELVLSAPEGPALRIPLQVQVSAAGFWTCPGKQIAMVVAAVLLLMLLIWLVRGFLSPAKFRDGAILTWARSHEALLRLRDGDEGYRKLGRFLETKRGFRRNAALHLGGARAPLPSLKTFPADARIEATPGGGAVLIVASEGLERFEESSGWVELKLGEYPLSNRITLRRGEETYLQFRR